VLKSLEHSLGHVQGATFSEVREINGRLEVTGKQWTIEADTVLKAIGQTLVLAAGLATLALRSGRILVDVEGRTSLAQVWAGGDCTYGGRDLTVEAVEHGKIAAHSIDRALGIQRSGKPFARTRRPA
jgi:glutamate synthase (NADPH/NADH) small chain